jgi:hypothetical protein
MMLKDKQCAMNFASNLVATAVAIEGVTNAVAEEDAPDRALVEEGLVEGENQLRNIVFL